MRSLRYAVGDIIYVVGRFLGRVAVTVGRVLIRIPVSIWRGIAGFWRSLSVISRRRLVAALGVAALLLIFFGAVVPNLPCRLPGGDRCPPADDAEELVPADALAYLHANLDPDTDEYSAAAGLAAKLPVFGSQVADRGLALIPSPDAGRLDFDDDVRPWFGGEAAIAVIAGPGVVPERVDLLEVADSEGASEYAKSLAVGQVQSAEYEGVEVSTDQQDVATAQVQGFLAIGTEDGVRAVIATATGADEAESLADDPVATDARDQLPEHRFAEAWVSEDGIRELIATDTGTLGTLSPVIAPGSSSGVAASLSAGDEGLEVAVRSVLDPEREKSSPSFFAAFPSFEPELPQRLRPETLAYLGIGAPEKTVTALLSQASVQAPGIAAGFEDLVKTLRHQGDVDIEGQLLGALGEEAAFALEPPQGQGDVPAAAEPPYLMFVADQVDEEAARKALAALQGPLADAADTGSDLQAPVFGQEEVSGVETNSLRISPTVELTYAVFDRLAAIATDPAGVAGVIEDEGGLDQQALYEDATDDFPDQVSLQAYFNLERLVGIGEQAGLAEDPLYATFAGDFRRLDALALAVSDDDDLLSTDVRLLIGEPPAGTGGDAVAPSAGD
ncbi:MAG: DUF3352 domain-containing protein [Vicinamibacteria bacterium]